MPDIMHLVRLDGLPAQAWAAIATDEGIKRWWTEDASFEARPSGSGVFRFHGGSRVTRVEVQRMQPPARMVWRVTESFRPEWVGTTIAFDLTADERETVLRFAHRGFPKPDDDYAVCTTGWGIYLGRLVAAMAEDAC